MKITFPVGTTHNDCKLIWVHKDCTCTRRSTEIFPVWCLGDDSICAQKYFQYVLSPSFKNRHLAELKIVCKNGWMPKIGMAPAER